MTDFRALWFECVGAYATAAHKVDPGQWEATGDEAAANYLRDRVTEAFVPREKYEKAQETVRKVQAAARTLETTRCEIYDHYRKASVINTEAVATLDSEREGNAILTAELEAAEARVKELEAALIRLRDCDWVITPRDRMDAVRNIARKALEASNG